MQARIYWRMGSLEYNVTLDEKVLLFRMYKGVKSKDP